MGEVRIGKLHAWLERKTGCYFGWGRITNRDHLIYFRFGRGEMVPLEAGFIWFHVYAGRG